MPFYVNTATVGGYLVADPELRRTGSGREVANLVVALNRPHKERPDYITCVAWGDRASALCAYAKRGQEITITGELETSTWADRKGTKHTTTQVIVERFCLGAKPKASEASVKKPSPPISG